METFRTCNNYRTRWLEINQPKARLSSGIEEKDQCAEYVTPPPGTHMFCIALLYVENEQLLLFLASSSSSPCCFSIVQIEIATRIVALSLLLLHSYISFERQ